VHGASAITAITAQNTREVRAIHPVPPEMVLAQVRAVLADIRVDAVKVGMLASAGIALAVAEALDDLPAGTPVVVDPVMVAESGARLLAPDARRALIEEILPRASVLTPNLPEARVLAGASSAGESAAGAEGVAGAEGAAGGERSVAGSEGKRSAVEFSAAEEEAEAQRLVRAVLALGPRVVVLTGGHRLRAADLFLDSADEGSFVSIDGMRHPDGAAHGSGCTHSSVLAAQLALGHTPLQAARTARALAGEAVARGLRDIGAGAGPVDVIDLARMRDN
jgi:hydroxymethylpyrimidine/phosphomethylpyrimidine kinase